MPCEIGTLLEVFNGHPVRRHLVQHGCVWLIDRLEVPISRPQGKTRLAIPPVAEQLRGHAVGMKTT